MNAHLELDTMHTLKTLVAAALLVGGAAARADAPQVPHTFTAGSAAKASEVNDNFAWLAGRLPNVTWSPSATYGLSGTPAGADVLAAVTTHADHPNHEVQIASLTLPAGSYLLSAKLVMYPVVPGGLGVAGGDLECVLGTADQSQVDFSSVNIDREHVLTAVVPLTLTASTTVSFACHVWGSYTDGSKATVHLWGGSIYAVQAASITKQ